MKPNFIIAGERRSGTSTLAKWIEIHPEIYLYPQLDTAYFLDDILRGRKEWLKGKIDTNLWNNNHSEVEYESLFNHKNSQIAIGEKSADYFFWQPSMERLNDMYPNIKIVLTFRNPIERAWSHYWNEVGKGRENLSFEEAIETEYERINNSDYAKVHLSYLERGKYMDSLKKLFKLKNSDQIHIIIFDELLINPQSTLKELYNFLGVDTKIGFDRVGKRYNHNWTTVPYGFWLKNQFLSSIEQNINKIVKASVRIIYRKAYRIREKSPKWEVITRKPQKKFKMSIEIRKKLIDYFEPYTNELEDYLRRDLNYWRK